MTTTVATTGAAAATGAAGSFLGADVDGLDKLSQEFTQAAQVVDTIKAACEAIVAAASMFGPFGAAFVAYLKGTVIPWLTKIGEALRLMSQVLSSHSQAQKDASSSATSLPSYSTPSALPAATTTSYPTMPASVGTVAPTFASMASSAIAGPGTATVAPSTLIGSLPA